MSQAVQSQSKLVDVTVQLPEALFQLLKRKRGDLGLYLKQQAALEQFQSGELSFGQAAALAGMSHADFVQLLSQHKISLFRYSPDELAEELSAL